MTERRCDDGDDFDERAERVQVRRSRPKRKGCECER